MSDPSISSSNKRREMMKKIENVLAQAEARVKASKEWNDPVSYSSELSDVSSDDEHFEISTRPSNIHFSDVSSIEHGSGTRSSELHVSDVSTDLEKGGIKDVDKSQIYSSDSEVSLKSLPVPESEDINPNLKGGLDSSLKSIAETAARSLLEELKHEAKSSAYYRPNPFTFQPTTARSRKKTTFSTTETPVHQDRYFESNGSNSSGNITPDAQYCGAPVISPPFSLSTPYGKKNTRTPPTTTKSSNSDDDRIISPPKMKSAASGRKSHKDNSSMPYMEEGIQNLRIELQNIQKESKRRVDKLMTADERFKESLYTLELKADAMANTLHQNFIRSSKLHQENEILREEIKQLTSAQKKRISSISAQINASGSKSPQTLIQELDFRDDYVKREYPPVPKTPGTMFTTELVEVMKLDVGDHAYLSEVMDRQWNTSSSYMPSLDKYQ